MRHYHVNTKEFAIGAAVGSLLGSVAALLIAPKSGKRLRQDICDTYCDISDKTQDLASRSKSFARSVGCQTCDWKSKAKSALKAVKGMVGEQAEEECAKDLLIGGVAGCVLGAVVGLLLAPKEGESLRQDLVDSYEDVSERTQEFANGISKKGRIYAKKARKNANKWLDFARDIVDDLTEDVQDSGLELVEKAKDLIHNERINEVMDWASLGYRMWQGIKQSKR